MAFTPVDTKDFIGFIYYHFNGMLEHKLAPFHHELIDLLKYQKIAIAAPRGFAKSTYYSLFYPLYVALTRPGTNIVCVSSTASLAEKWLGKIRWELENNGTLLATYGKQEGPTWTTSLMKLNNGSALQCTGATGRIRGDRPHLLILDDIETDELVANPRRLEELTDWFKTAVLGTRRPDTQVILIGTILDHESFLADWISNPRVGWYTRIYTAITDDGSSLWPDMYPIKVLDEWQQELGTYAFRQEYMNDPVPAEFRTFQEKWIKYAEELPKDLVYFCTIDSAQELTKKADFTAFVTCAIDIDRNIYVIEAKRQKLLPSEIIDGIFRRHLLYPSLKFGIEQDSYGKMLKHSFEQERRLRKEYPSLTTLNSYGRRKSLRIEGLQPFFECGKIYFALTNGNTEDTFDDLRTELLRYPSPRCHDDLVDALAYQLDIIRAAKDRPQKIMPGTVAALEQQIDQATGSEQVWGRHSVRRYNSY